MSDISSDYDLSKLYAGITMAGMASVAAMTATHLTGGLHYSWSSILPLAYGLMLCASSYVEEEHQFWYWVSSAWMLWLFFRQWVLDESLILNYQLRKGLARTARAGPQPLVQVWLRPY